MKKNAASRDAPMPPALEMIRLLISLISFESPKFPSRGKKVCASQSRRYATSQGANF
jgi:hypothetical protein